MLEGGEDGCPFSTGTRRAMYAPLAARHACHTRRWCPRVVSVDDRRFGEGGLVLVAEA